MRASPRASIRRKIVWVIMAVCLLALTFAAGAVLVYETIHYRRILARDLRAQANIVGVSSSAALAFQDPKTGCEILAALRARPEIVYACLYDVHGRVFASYSTPGFDGGTTPTHPEPDREWSGRNFLSLFQTVHFGTDKVGTIFLKASLRQQDGRVRNYMILLAGVMVTSLTVGLLFSAWLQRIISTPILAIERTMRRVAEKKEYSLRVPNPGNDEIGSLARGFNEMLSEIQTRDEALRRGEQRLMAVLDHTSAFVYLKDCEGRYLLVNRRFEAFRPKHGTTLIGKTDFEVVSREFAEVWRENDRKVIEARHAMEFEERAPLLDGVAEVISLKTPLLDDSGKVYALCGISTDVTERRRLQRQVLEISDREQQRIGLDLHDGLCQHLAATGYAASSLEDKLNQKHLTESAEARVVAELIREAIRQARTLSRQLYPVRLQSDGFVSALQELMFTTEALWGVHCRFEGDSSITIPDLPTATHLYRIAQEAVANAVKHAGAKNLRARLESSNRILTLSIADDGRGIPDPAQRGAGMGLHIVQYRARLIGATVNIETAPGGGTMVTCVWSGKADSSGTPS